MKEFSLFRMFTIFLLFTYGVTKRLRGDLDTGKIFSSHIVDDFMIHLVLYGADTHTTATVSSIVTSYSSWTYYNAYPRCCQNQANYDPTYSTTECVYYNGCAHPGSFAAIGQRSLSYVEK
jgi:hypothetical protein